MVPGVNGDAGALDDMALPRALADDDEVALGCKSDRHVSRLLTGPPDVAGGGE
jgi:hypothetical protein